MGWLIVQSAWLAFADTVRPRVLLMSLWPLGIAGLAGLLASPWVGRATTIAHSWMGGQAWLVHALQTIGLDGWLGAMAWVIAAAVAGLAMLVLVLVTAAVVIAPMAASHIAKIRYGQLHRQARPQWVRSLAHSLAISAVGIVLLILSLPLWLIPVVGVLVAPAIWGWVTARVFASDALVPFTSGAEYAGILHDHRWALWGMGVVCTYAGILPTALFSVAWLAWAFLPATMLLALWAYVLVSVFSALWFVHYLLAALAQRRRGFMDGAA